jgi:DNA-binding NarL/FixJ family response regulator
MRKTPAPRLCKVSKYRGLGKQLRILVVDDSQDFLDAICGLLELEESVEVVGTAGDGAEALNSVASLDPDLVLMEVNMAYLDGTACTELLSRHFPRTAVILMSGDHSPQLRERCLACGAIKFVPKELFLSERVLALLQPDRILPQ